MNHRVEHNLKIGSGEVKSDLTKMTPENRARLPFQPSNDRLIANNDQIHDQLAPEHFGPFDFRGETDGFGPFGASGPKSLRPESNQTASPPVQAPHDNARSVLSPAVTLVAPNLLADTPKSSLKQAAVFRSELITEPESRTVDLSLGP